MKTRFLKTLAITLVAALMFVFVACSPEIIYVADFTGSNSSSGSGSSNAGTNVSPTPSTPTTTVQTEDPNFKGDGGSYSLRIWCAEEDEEMIREMLDAYERKYSNNHYDWTVERQGEDIVSASVTRDVEAAADVFSFANDQLGILVNNSALTQITDSQYIAQIDQQIDVARLAATYNSSYYAFPYSYENCFLYYNKSLITDVSSMEGILSAGIADVDFNLGIDMSDSYYTTMFLYTAGVTIFGDQGNDPNDVNLDNENAYKACRYIASLAGQKKLGSISKADQFASLKNGKVAAMISGPHMISQFKNALGSNFAVATLPTIKLDGKDTPLISFSGVKMYGVSRKTARDKETTKEALKLAAYLSNSTNQAKRLQDREFCPTDADLFDAAISSDIETVEVVVEQAANSKLKPGLIQMSSYWDNMKGFLLGVYKLSYAESTWSKELKKVEAKLKG